MKIKEWEKKVGAVYKMQKYTDFSEVAKLCLTHPEPKEGDGMTPYAACEGYADGEVFYAAYVFDEEEITGRKIDLTDLRSDWNPGGAGSGWDKTVVLMFSCDGVYIDYYDTMTSNAYHPEEVPEFFRLINPFPRPKNATNTLFDNNILKAVEIKNQIDDEHFSFGSGTFIDKDGTILTNKHVVQNTNTQTNYQQFWVRTADMTDWVAAELVNVSTDYDLAMLRCNLRKKAFVLTDKGIADGEIVYVIGGSTWGAYFIKTEVACDNANGTGKTVYILKSYLVDGESNNGAPVFNKDGKLLGIVSFRLRNNPNAMVPEEAFIVPVADIKDFLAK